METDQSETPFTLNYFFGSVHKFTHVQIHSRLVKLPLYIDEFCLASILMLLCFCFLGLGLVFCTCGQMLAFQLWEENRLVQY